MIQPQRLHGTPANIARYYTVGDYYTKGGNEPSEWGGKLAADLGLSGAVDPKLLRDLLAGKVGDQQLGRHRADGEIQHHPVGILRSMRQSRFRSWGWWQVTNACSPPMSAR